MIPQNSFRGNGRQTSGYNSRGTLPSRGSGEISREFLPARQGREPRFRGWAAPGRAPRMFRNHFVHIKYQFSARALPKTTESTEVREGPGPWGPEFYCHCGVPAPAAQAAQLQPVSRFKGAAHPQPTEPRQIWGAVNGRMGCKVTRKETTEEEEKERPGGRGNREGGREGEDRGQFGKKE